MKVRTNPKFGLGKHVKVGDTLFTHEPVDVTAEEWKSLKDHQVRHFGVPTTALVVVEEEKTPESTSKKDTSSDKGDK